jgi:hypothetical protein
VYVAKYSVAIPRSPVAVTGERDDVLSPDYSRILYKHSGDDQTKDQTKGDNDPSKSIKLLVPKGKLFLELTCATDHE